MKSLNKFLNERLVVNKNLKQTGDIETATDKILNYIEKEYDIRMNDPFSNELVDDGQMYDTYLKNFVFDYSDRYDGGDEILDDIIHACKGYKRMIVGDGVGDEQIGWNGHAGGRVYGAMQMYNDLRKFIKINKLDVINIGNKDYLNTNDTCIYVKNENNIILLLGPNNVNSNGGEYWMIIIGFKNI